MRLLYLYNVISRRASNVQCDPFVFYDMNWVKVALVLFVIFFMINMKVCLEYVHKASNKIVDWIILK